MQWRAFAEAAPELAKLGMERFHARQLCMVGTLRRNGWPRISPCELDFVEGELMLGMMWRSPKALDLIREPRCVLHSCTWDRDGSEGDFKLYARAVAVEDAPRRDAYRRAIKARIDWEPTDPYHLFAMDIDSAAYVAFAGQRIRIAWDPERGERRTEQRLE